VHFHSAILRHASERFNFRNGSVGEHPSHLPVHSRLLSAVWKKRLEMYISAVHLSGASQRGDLVWCMKMRLGPCACACACCASLLLHEAVNPASASTGVARATDLNLVVNIESLREIQRCVELELAVSWSLTPCSRALPQATSSLRARACSCGRWRQPSFCSRAWHASLTAPPCCPPSALRGSSPWVPSWWGSFVTCSRTTHYLMTRIHHRVLDASPCCPPSALRESSRSAPSWCRSFDPVCWLTVEQEEVQGPLSSSTSTDRN